MKAAVSSLFALAALLPAADAATPGLTLGKQIATQGSSTAAPCFSCHGQQGEGLAASGFPRIAGMPAGYLDAQLKSLRDGRRSNPVMSTQAKALSNEQIAAVSAY